MARVMLRIRLSEGSWLFLAGPLRARVVRGCVEVFGWEFHEGSCFSISRLRSAPLLAKRESELELEVLGREGGYVTEPVDTPLIPEEWRRASERIVAEAVSRRSTTVFVVGDVDTGKTGFITYLANRLLFAGRSVYVIDCDVGQQDISYPTCIGLGKVTRPIVHLSEVEMVDAFFIGRTSPAGVFERIVYGVSYLSRRAAEEGADVIIVDTTGWVRELGRELKVFKLLTLSPDFIVLIEREKELEFVRALTRRVQKSEILSVPASPMLRARTREERREIRESIFRSAFEGARTITLKLHELSILYGYLGSGLLKRVGERICEEHPEFVYVFSEKPLSQQETQALETALGKKVKVITPDVLENWLVALVDENMHFLGLGVVLRYDAEKDELTVLTRAPAEKVAGLMWGHMKVTPDGKEVAWLSPWSI